MNKKEVELRLKEIIRRSNDIQNVYTPIELCEEMISKLPELNKDQKILVMFNLEFVWVIREKLGRENIKNLWFYTYDSFKKMAAMGMGMNENHIIVSEYNKIKTEDMPKFDVVVGNPPYKDDLHLKFLQLAVNTAKDNGNLVWLQPSRWVQDPFAPYKKNSDYNKYKHLPFTDFEIVEDANEKFGIGAHSQIIISTLDKTKKSILSDGYFISGPFLQKSPYQKSILDKVRKKMNITLADVVKIDEPYIDKYCVMVSPIGPGDRKTPTRGYLAGKKWQGIFEKGKLNGKKVREIKTKQKHVKNYDKIFFVPFNTKKEAENFIESSKTIFIKFWMTLITSNIHIMFEHIPFMDNYNIIWKDEDYKIHFNLSNEEINYIKSQIK